MTARPLSLALLLIAACAPQTALEVPPELKAPTVASAAPVAPPAVAVAPSPEAAPPVSPPSLSPPPPPPPPVTLVELQSLTRSRVAALLGAPDLFREEPGAEVLLYSQPACALHLILYPPAGGGTPEVAYAETIPAAAESESERACLDELLARAR